MSTHLITSIPRATSMGVRFTSNSSSASYLTAFRKRNFDYLQAMGGDSFPLTQFPQLISSALKTESATRKSDKMPLIHSTPATLRPGISLTGRLATQTASQLGIARSCFQEPLRAPCHTYGERQLDQLMLRIQRVKEFGNDKPDYHPELRKALLSANYGLLSNPVKGESAAFYVAKNWMADKDSSKAIQIATSMMTSTLQIHGFSEDEIQEIIRSYIPILEQYMNLPLGDLYIFAIPNQIVPEIAFDSKPYGIPTFRNPLESLNSLDTCSRLLTDGGHQARIAIDLRITNATHGIDVIYLNDHEKVAKYTEGHSLVPVEELEIFDGFNLGKRSETEESYQMQKAILDRRCQEIEEHILRRAYENIQKIEN